MTATARDDQITLGSVVLAVPTVIIIFEGGPNALKTVQNALNENTPAVIIEGSGRAADILTYAFRHAQTIEVKDENGDDIKRRTEKNISPEVAAEIRKQMNDLKFCQEQDIDDNIKRIVSCIAKSCLIQIFKWNSDNRDQDLRMAILKALLKAYTNQMKDENQQQKDANQQQKDANQQLKDNSQLIDRLGLALVWNIFDIAKCEIFTENQRWESDNLNNIMLLAIWMNSANFVELFLDNGIDLKTFLTIKRLLRLYNQVSPTSLLKRLFNNMRQTTNNEISNESITFDEVGQLIQDFVGDYYNVDMYFYNNQEDDVCMNPERELLIWSVLNSHQETAELFWRSGKDAIAAALVASALYTAMSHRTGDNELKKQLTENANKFTELANGVLKECNRTDKVQTEHLLVQMVEEWGKTSCIMIAIEAKNMRFISQNACQDLFQRIWTGKKIQENVTPRMQGQSNPSPDDNNEKVPKDGTGDGTENKVNSSSFRKTPMIAFCFHMISYIIFLGLYSFVLISKLEETFSVEEAILIAWVITIFVEEIRQVCTRAIGKSKFRTYIKDGWNKIDVITISLFVVGMILRGIPYPEALEAARVVLGVNLVTFFTRLLHVFCVHKDIGPKLVMILHTLKNLPYFIVILMVFLVAYSIASHAILYPNTELTLDTFVAIFRRPYWNIYGELMLDEIEDAVGCTRDAELYRNGTHDRCPTVSGQYVGPVLLGAYMLMCNILLLNLLIVMFGEEYEKVKNNVDMYWNLQLLSLIDEYYSRPIVPPPFIIIEHIYWLTKRTCHGKPRKRAFYRTLDSKYNTKLRDFEQETAYKFHYKRTQGEQYDKQSNDFQGEELKAKMDSLQKQQQKVTEIIDNLLKGQERIENHLETQMKLIKDSLVSPRKVSSITHD